MIKLFIISAIVLGTYVATTLGQGGTPYPVPDQFAVQCMTILNSTKSIEKCRNDSMAAWNTIKTSEEYGTLRDFCCEIYGEIDCVINATKAQCQTQNKSSLLVHQQNLLNYWSQSICLPIKYHTSICSKVFPPPQTPLVSSCFAKIVTHVDECTNKGKRDWKLTFLNITDPKSKNVCCANWDISDCIVAAAKDSCTLSELSSFEQYYNQISQIISGVNCSKFYYHSKECSERPFPPLEPPIVLKCLGKIYNHVTECTDKGKKDWQISGSNTTIHKDCCANWDISDCIESAAKDKCNYTELINFRLHFDFVNLKLSDKKCINNQYHSSICKPSSSSVTSNNWLITAIILSIVYFFMK